MTNNSKRRQWRPIIEALVFLSVIFLVFGLLSWKMGGANMLKTLMNTAHDLLLNTVFYLMGITVLTGALSKLMSEFGVVTLLERVLRPLMKPLYNLPGVAALGGVMTFLSDNPAIIALSKDRKFASYFKKYQLISLTNFGTAFGMGFVVIITMIGYGQMTAALIGLAGAVCGSIISTRLMQRSCLKAYPELDSPAVEDSVALEAEDEASADEPSRSIFMRFLNAVLDGGKNGVDLGLQIIPGVLIITTAVIMVTFGTGPSGVYDGSSSQGVPVLPWLAEKIHWVFEWLFGFTHMELIAFPMTALGAVGAALGLLPTFNAAGILDGNAIAVFTAIGMCWSGFLSTHTAMLDSLGYRKAISKAIGAHAIAGLCAGIIAHFLFLLVGLV
ncbi:MAG: nucleoside recognition domain-containing protein [Bacteroidales bacterium]|nr:nucleoside recognition domain-containing protein [Bacteroidales bacterium]